MNKFEVLAKYVNGTEEVMIIEAFSANDARWSVKQMEGVYEATVLRRVRNDGRDNPSTFRFPENDPVLKSKALAAMEKENRTLSNLIITALKSYLK